MHEFRPGDVVRQKAEDPIYGHRVQGVVCSVGPVESLALFEGAIRVAFAAWACPGFGVVSVDRSASDFELVMASSGWSEGE